MIESEDMGLELVNAVNFVKSETIAVFLYDLRMEPYCYEYYNVGISIAL